MKKYFVGALVLALMGAGCGDDNSSPLTPGDPADPAFQTFTAEFDAIDGGTGLMVESVFGVVEGIFNSAPGTPPAVAGDFQYSLEWDAAGEQWVANVIGSDPESGVAFTLGHTVQFIQDGSSVQYPDPALLDRINSSTEMELTGEGINSAGGTQDMVFDVQPLEQDVLLTLNGSGTANLDATHVETTQTGTTTCNVVFNFTAEVSDVQIWASAAGGEGGCPIDGDLSYQGSANIACSGDGGSVNVNGNWGVTQTFSPSGTVTTQVVHGTNFWTVEEPCY